MVGSTFGDAVRVNTFPIRRILCPVDFSAPATRAFQHAIALATWCGAEVTVLHVHAVRAAAGSAPPGVLDFLRPAPLTYAEQVQLKAALRAFVSAENRSSIFVDWVIDEASDVPGAIAAHGDDINADVIVLGTHGYAGFRRFVLGSVTEQVLRRARRAVLAVPPGAASSPVIPSCQRILCPTDFSRGAAHALGYAATIASRAHALLTVAHIIEFPPQVPELPDPDWSAYRSARFAHARADLATAVEPWREQCQLHELVLAGTPIREILRLTTDLPADLVVMGMHGRGAIDLMLFGSVAQATVRQATCPVLTVPAVSLVAADVASSAAGCDENATL